MSAENDFVPFATGEEANVLELADYDDLAPTGNVSGVASSAFVNRALRQATYMAACLASFLADTTGLNVLDDGNSSEVISTMNLAFRTPPSVQVFAAGSSGTWYPSFVITCTALGSAITAGATYTDSNSHTFTAQYAASGATQFVLTTSAGLTPAASGTLTKAPGTGGPTSITYSSIFTGPVYLKVKGVGGGAGGAGSSTVSAANGGTGGAGGNTTFGTTLLVADGAAETLQSPSGVAGSFSLGTGPIGVGGSGSIGGSTTTGTSLVLGGSGASSIFSGGSGTTPAGDGGAAGGSPGAGGGGCGFDDSTVLGLPGSGGSAGGWFDVMITGSLLATLLAGAAYAVGSGGAGGTAGTSGGTGGAGAGGVLIIEEHYQ